MEIRITYKGTLNGVKGLWCGFKPKGIEIGEEIPVYYPDEGKVFTKDGEEFTSVVLQEGESIEDYEEIIEEDEEPSQPTEE